MQVSHTNHAPTVSKALTNQSVTSGQAFSYTVITSGSAANFSDRDAGDTLTLSATLANGTALSNLPSWLSFDAVSGRFQGTAPANSNSNALNIRVNATDRAGLSVSSSFTLNVADIAPPAGALVGTPNKDTLTADSAHTEVWGLAGDDVINGFWGSSHLVGGAGNDIINGIGGPNNILDGGSGDNILTGGWGNDIFFAADGNNIVRVQGGSAQITLGGGDNKVFGNWGDDTITTGDGNNTINAGGGANNVRTGAGNDVITTDWGNDTINAGDGNNTISAGEGSNTIVSGGGNDTITALGVNVVISGAGNDKITLGWGNDWIEAGKGNDTIDAGGGANLFAFNKGDGADTIVHSTWSADTISLGGGIKFGDLKLAKSGNDLILITSVDAVAGNDQITLKDWYKADQNKGVGKLQVITTGGDYSANSTNALNNRAVTVFDFSKLVQTFDAARVKTPTLGTTSNTWAVSSSLGAAQLNASAAPASIYSITNGIGNYVNPWIALQAGTALQSNAPIAAINPIGTASPLSLDQLLFAALSSANNTPAQAGWKR